MDQVVIVSGARTPIGGYGGTLRNVPVYRLASLVLNEVVNRAKIEPAQVDDVIMGQSYQNGECANGARMALLEAGWPDTVPDSVNKALDKAGIDIDQVDLIEIQEAFAVQALADARLMGIAQEDFDKKINVNGSGVSLGHPIAATGAMRLVTLLHEMKRRSARYGLETICGGGGQGIGMVVEAV